MIRLAFCAVLLCVRLARADPFVDSQVNHATPTQQSCTTTSRVISPYVSNVIARTVLNQSSTDAYLCFAATCTTANGTRFQENMGLVEQTYTGPISCITASGTATLGVTVR